MEIKNLRANAIRSYEMAASTVPVKKETGNTRSNTDKVDFDFKSALAAAKADAAGRIDAEASAGRIGELQAAYAGENCPASSEDIAKAILGI